MNKTISLPADHDDLIVSLETLVYGENQMLPSSRHGTNWLTDHPANNQKLSVSLTHLVNEFRFDDNVWRGSALS